MRVFSYRLQKDASQLLQLTPSVGSSTVNFNILIADYAWEFFVPRSGKRSRSSLVRGPLPLCWEAVPGTTGCEELQTDQVTAACSPRMT